jgi:pyridoxal 5'-phosphate synthase pdxS subunit
MINDQTAGGMATELPTNTTNGESNGKKGEANFTVKTGLARMLKGGVIMDVVNAEQVWVPLSARCWYNGSHHSRQE